MALRAISVKLSWEVVRGGSVPEPWELPPSCRVDPEAPGALRRAEPCEQTIVWWRGGLDDHTSLLLDHVLVVWFLFQFMFHVNVLDFDLRRNCYIKNVLLFEADSIVPLPVCLESS